MEFRDLKTQYTKYEAEINQAIVAVMQETDFINGKKVKQFEERLAKYIGVKHCIACGNGTDALTLVLMAWDIKEGDAVFVPNFTFFATGEVVSYEGATPIFVDIDEDTFNIDVKHLETQIKKVIKEGKLTPKVIIPVDLFGLAANHSEIEKVAKKYSLKVLDDAAQSFGASINGKMVGSFGDAATTSFFPAKPLGCYGDGGAIFTNDDELASLIRSFAFHGKGTHKYDNVRVGVNSRLDTIQAAILDVKLSAFINHELSDVNKVFEQYTNRLHGIVKTPVIPKGYYSSFAQYTITLKSKEERDGLAKFLNDNNIPTNIYYPKTMHQQTAFAYLNNTDQEFPVSSKLVDLVLALPMHPYLNETELSLVVEKIREYLK